MTKTKNTPELMAPAGSFVSLRAAIKAGADSIYFGLEELNMRSLAAHNFTLKDLGKIVQICKKNKVKSYLTLNSLMYDEDLQLMRKIADNAKASGVDAVIASDMAALKYLESINLPAHISTQMNVGNLEAVRFFAQYADTVVLARELTLKQISKIIEAVEKEKIIGPSGQLIKIEIFIHGALCVAISGKCYMSLALYNHSANRGKCFQPCRRKYKITDESTEKELSIDNQFVMSPKDLCTISFLDQIVQSGVKILKIEGRGRSPEYVWTVVSCYRKALNSIAKDAYTSETIKLYQEELKTVYNRGFWEGGYYLGHKLGEWANHAGSKATFKRTYLGKAVKYFSKLKVAEFILETGSLKLGDEVYITGPTTGLLKLKIDSLHTQGQAASAAKGEKAALFTGTKIRRNDQLYLIEQTSAF